MNATALERLHRLGGVHLVRQMLELYLVHGAERVRTITEAAAASDADRVQRAAHAMKSSAGNVGAERLQQTAEALEALAAEGTIDRAMVERLVREYEESADALRGMLEEQQP